jgi:hypothetical protein
MDRNYLFQAIITESEQYNLSYSDKDRFEQAKDNLSGEYIGKVSWGE